MAITLGEQSGNTAYGISVYYIDGAADVANLPIACVKFGSCAFDMSNGDLYFLRTDPTDPTMRKWVKLDIE